MAAKKKTKKKAASKGRPTKKKSTKKAANKRATAKKKATKKKATKKKATKKKATKKKARPNKATTASPAKKHRIYGMSFARVYPMYVKKAEQKGRKKKEVDEVICWLTGYNMPALKKQIKLENDFETFFNEAPKINPKANKITGTICGVRIEEIEDPLMLKIRYLDKLVDELAKGRPMEKVLRES